VGFLDFLPFSFAAIFISPSSAFSSLKRNFSVGLLPRFSKREIELCLRPLSLARSVWNRPLGRRFCTSFSYSFIIPAKGIWSKISKEGMKEKEGGFYEGVYGDC